MVTEEELSLWRLKVAEAMDRVGKEPKEQAYQVLVLLSQADILQYLHGILLP